MGDHENHLTPILLIELLKPVVVIYRGDAYTLDIDIRGPSEMYHRGRKVKAIRVAAYGSKEDSMLFNCASSHNAHLLCINGENARRVCSTVDVPVVLVYMY